MKRGFLSLLIGVFLIFPVLAALNADIAKAAESEVIKGNCMPPEKSYSEVRKMDFGNNLECVLKMRYYPEVRTASCSKEGDPFFVRQVATHFEFYHIKKDKLPRKISEHTLRVTFMYDKNSSVYILDRDEDIIFNRAKVPQASKKWKTAYSHEVLYGKNMCIVSEMVSISKYKVFGERMKYMENSHMDIMCSPQGNLAINTKNMYERSDVL